LKVSNVKYKKKPIVNLQIPCNERKVGFDGTLTQNIRSLVRCGETSTTAFLHEEKVLPR
jgi:hypothetical protein